jgi:hypothetical protein
MYTGYSKEFTATFSIIASYENYFQLLSSRSALKGAVHLFF